jgi:murein DD-endopeptidase MepM/ murein hydrolase activator NlpD
MFFVIFAAGCTGLEVEREVLTTQPSRPAKRAAIPSSIHSEHSQEEFPKKVGAYHKVNKSETIWRIAKTYGVTIQDIIASNNIPDVAKIEANQLIFIPGASQVLSVPVETDTDEDAFIWPLQGAVTRYFREVKGGASSAGIDIKSLSVAKVKASRRGRVIFADYLAGYGYTAILDHEDGFYTVYANNAKLLVNLGERIPKSTHIAMVGGSRQEEHLHFQIRKNNREENPLHYLP